MDFGISVAESATIDVEIMFLGCGIGRHGMTPQPLSSNLSKNIILASIFKVLGFI
jgi:hypothetical protein